MLTWYGQLLRFAPYPLLAISVLVSSITPGTTFGSRWIIVGLSAAAALWTWLLHTRRSDMQHGVGLFVYFAGFLVLSGLLMSIDMLFFIYTIAGFLHAVFIRPAWAGIGGIFLTSVSLNTGTMGPPENAGDLGLLAVVITIQTAAIGMSIPVQDRMEAQHEKRRQTVTKLEEALEENAELHAQLLNRARESGAEAERQRLAREIHDTLAQGLAGIVTQLEAADHAQLDEDRQRHLTNASRLARDSLAEARRTVHAVAPAELEDARLAEAIGQVVDQWSELHQVPAEMVTTGTPQALHPEVEVTLLRIAQEALANVAKHAAASRVGLTLSYMGDVVTLDVRDDGRGFDGTAVNADRTPQTERVETQRPAGRRGEPVIEGGFGLTGMRNRAARLAGRFEVETEVGGGTAVSVRVPAMPPGDVEDVASATEVTDETEVSA